MIQVEGLTKYYGYQAAIQGLDFNIERGEVIGFLGLNGAGKSTTLKILGCILLPTAGRVRIDGLNVVEHPHEIRKKIGYLPDTPPLYDEMTVGSYLAFVAQLRGVPARDARRRVEEVEARTGLQAVDRSGISTLSHGYRQRVGLAQALVHNPELLILDEPTSGLDPGQIVEMRSLIKGLKGRHTVLVSSHILSEIHETCDRLLVIQNGRIAGQGTEAELAQRAGSQSQVELEVAGAVATAVTALKSVPGVVSVTVVREDGASSALRVEASTDARAALVRALVAAQVDVLRVDRPERLESIFLKLTHGKDAKQTP
jgi:ABC-2 type transport system ATP-binding protein